MRALDIVKTPEGGIAIVTSTVNKGKRASISFIGDINIAREKNSWWEESELQIIDSIPHFLALAMEHPFNSKSDVNELFPLTVEENKKNQK